MHDVLERQTSVIWIVDHRHVDLRGNIHAVAAGTKVFHGAAKDLLTCAHRIHVGGIEVIDAKFQRLPNEWARLLLFEYPRPPLFRSIRHRAQAKSRDFQSSGSKIDVVHRKESLALRVFTLKAHRSRGGVSV